MNRNQKITKLYLLLKYLYLFYLGGHLYCLIEIAFRGKTHWTMFIVGGICFIYAGIQNERTSWDYPLWKQILRVETFVLTLEFISGCIVNLWLGWNVWNYDSMPLNLLGQICLPFALLFLPICAAAIILDDYLRWAIFNEEKPKYRLF